MATTEQRGAGMMDSTSFDFFDFSTPPQVELPSGVTTLFACSTSTEDSCGSVAITPDAVYVGEGGVLTRIDADDIRSWYSSGHGQLFALTVTSEDAHVTHLFEQFRRATVTAMTETIGPENVQLRAA